MFLPEISDKTSLRSFPTSDGSICSNDGGYFFTETEKRIARSHEIPAAFLDKLWASLDGAVTVDAQVIFAASGGECRDPAPLPDLAAGAGFSCEFALAAAEPGILLDSRGADGRGMVVEYTPDHRISLGVNDSRQEWRAVSEAVPRLSRAVVAVDGGPGVVSFVADGVFLDGGEEQEFGWRRFNPATRSCVDDAIWRIGEKIAEFRIWDSALLTCEAVALTRRK